MSRDKRPIAVDSPSSFSWRRWLVIGGTVLLVATAIGRWWGSAPDRWVRQAESLLPQQPAQADALAEEALGAGASVRVTARAWLVRCRAQLLLRKPIEALGAYAQLEHPEECKATAWCALIQEAKAANHLLLADLAMSSALRIPQDRTCVLTLVLPDKSSTLPDDEVAALVEELRNLAGSQPASWHAIGVAEQARGRLAEAVAAFRRGVELSQISQAIGLTIRRELAQLLIDLGQFSEAEPLIGELIATSPATSEDQLRRAQLRRASGDRSGARKLLDELLATDADSLPAHLLRGIVLAELEELEKAQRDFEWCLRVAPFHAEVHYRLSQILLRLGESTTAAHHVREHQRLSELQRRLLEVYRRRAAAPQDPKLMVDAAEILEALGQPQQAANWRRAAESLRKSH